jgi:hypothetical protein
MLVMEVLSYGLPLGYNRDRQRKNLKIIIEKERDGWMKVRVKWFKKKEI